MSLFAVLPAQVVVAASLAYLRPILEQPLSARSAARMIRYLDMRDDVAEYIGVTEAMQLISVLGELEGAGIRLRCPRVRTWAMQAVSCQVWDWVMQVRGKASHLIHTFKIIITITLLS